MLRNLHEDNCAFDMTLLSAIVTWVRENPRGLLREHCTMLDMMRNHPSCEFCSISSPAIGKLSPVAPLTGQSPHTVRIGLWHALWEVTSALFIFYCSFACLSYLSAGTHYDRL